MADVKWIKITTDMFDDEKIDYVQSLPEGDSILIIWIRLLTMAGKCNEAGKIFLTESMPYTIDALSHKFKKPESIIKLSLKTFSSLGMIQVSDDGMIFISNFTKYQNMEGLEKIKQREYEKLKKRKQRQKLKELPTNNNKNDDVPGTVPGQSPGTPSTVDKELEEERDIDKELDNKRESKEENSSLSNKGIDLCKYWQELKPNESITKDLTTLKTFIEQYGFDWTKEAMQITVQKKNKFIPGYVKAILKDWKANGKPDNTKKVAKIYYKKKESTFNNFKQRSYDFKELEKKLLGWDKE